jgi:hypothetical protein
MRFHLPDRHASLVRSEVVAFITNLPDEEGAEPQELACL